VIYGTQLFDIGGDESLLGSAFMARAFEDFSGFVKNRRGWVDEKHDIRVYP